jgi:hypothetical protein
LKKTILTLFALTLYIGWTQFRIVPAPKPDMNVTKEVQQTQRPYPQAEDPKTALSSPPQNEETQLREQLAQLDHELARAGYPEVLLDDRLSEAEREELISKVLVSTNLYSQIVRLKIAAIQGQRQ